MLQPIQKPLSVPQRVAATLLLRFLRKLKSGRLELRFPDGTVSEFGQLDTPEIARIDIHDGAFFTKVLMSGDIGFGEAYTMGLWSSPDLTAVLEVFGRNLDHADDRSILLTKLGRRLHRRLHQGRANTKQGSRKNIHDHYDLSNDFFALFLDESMTYSCALFEEPEQPLAEAQINKLQAMCRAAAIEQQHHVLEIGSGWGSFAIEAVKATGCRVTSITLSEEQLRLAQQRAADAGVADRIEFRLCDYRDVQGTYDRVVSIEMLEAVGHEFFRRYFEVINEKLKPGGLAAIQTITIPHERYEAYRDGCDWVQKHIFPGGHLPSIEVLQQTLRGIPSLAIDSVRAIGPHYARTLRLWREAFLRRLDDVIALGFDETFCRKWVYYLCYCEAGFSTAAIDTLHLVLRKSNDG